ncbi:MurR/RpiR family transcriptional regulator [Clostridium paraputrificum]|uniref:MurR/RpiR family transcriptional regulator n=1 Tax=Clostridium paraputrificum TaxID=29363 RepID=UPI00374EC80F
MNIELLSHKHNLDTLERKLLQYLYDNIDEIKSIGIRKLASDNYTSTSMVYKLVKKLGFEGYSDMIHYISYTYNKSENNNENAYSKLYDTVKPYKKDFNSILSEYKNKQIVITGMGFSDIISNFISEALFLKGYNCAHTLYLQLLSPENKDNLLIIAISRSGKTSRLVELVEEANTHGFKIISFTANKNSKLAKASTLSVPIGSYDSFKSISEEFNTFFGELLLIFEYLTN